MPFMIGKHRELDEIDENDIMAIALDLSLSLNDWDDALRQVIDGFAQSSAITAKDDLADDKARILDNATPRIAVLKRFCQES